MLIEETKIGDWIYYKNKIFIVYDDATDTGIDKYVLDLNDGGHKIIEHGYKVDFCSQFTHFQQATDYSIYEEIPTGCWFSDLDQNIYIKCYTMSYYISNKNNPQFENTFCRFNKDSAIKPIGIISLTYQEIEKL